MYASPKLSTALREKYEPVIGLEGSRPVAYADQDFLWSVSTQFGLRPHKCLSCMPGAVPVHCRWLNKRAWSFCGACFAGAELPGPRDLQSLPARIISILICPRGDQISQFDKPLAETAMLRLRRQAAAARKIRHHAAAYGRGRRQEAFMTVLVDSSIYASIDLNRSGTRW